MVGAILSVVIYSPLAHSMAHWAIYLKTIDGDETKHLIYQANGNEGALKLNIREADPKKSQRFLKQVDVSNIDGESTVNQVKQALRKQPMNNDVSSWNCQDWVLGALEALNDEALLNEYQYHDAKDTLSKLYYE